MKFVVILSVLLIFVCPSLQDEVTRDEKWQSFKSTNNKIYQSTDEEELRKGNFLKNLDIVTKHNTLFEQGRVKYEMTVPKLADLSFDEFVKIRTGFVPSDNIPNNNKINFTKPQSDEGNEEKNLDWTKKGVVGPVRDQGECGNCYIFGVVALIETFLNRVEISINNLDLSEQQLLDCARTSQLKGCDGGDPLELLELLIKKVAGIAGENSYPYEAEQAKCRRSLAEERYFVSFYNYYKGPVAKEDDLLYVLYMWGPIMVGITVTPNFACYKSGIYEKDNLCTPEKEANHMVLVTGYGETEDGTKYWIIKNSWGEDFGVKGYMKIARGKGLCKIGTFYAYAGATF